jgi:hypothetical protein
MMGDPFCYDNQTVIPAKAKIQCRRADKIAQRKPLGPSFCWGDELIFYFAQEQILN